jgi:hypothetical protein
MWLLFLLQVSERKGRVANSKVRPRNWNVHVSNELHHPWKLSIGRLLEDTGVFVNFAEAAFHPRVLYITFT